MNSCSLDQRLRSTARPHRAKHRALLITSCVFVIGTIATACSSTTKSSSSASPSPGTSATSAFVVTTMNAKLGTILVDSKGFTLYRLNKDSIDKSVCTASCREVWPPLLVTGSGSPVGGSGVTGLGTVRFSGGDQVTYQGMPLYTFTGDTSPGQTNGQNLTDTWGTWFVIVTKAPVGSTTPTRATTPTTVNGGGGGPAF